MSETPHIAIIGAGLIGLTSASALAARGLKVKVFDARPGPCEGASFCNSGMIHPSQARSWSPDQNDREIANAAASSVVKLGERSAHLLHIDFERLKMRVPLNRPTGCIQVYETLVEAERAQSDFDAIGVETRVIVDWIDTLGKPACFFKGDSSANARDYGVALEADLRARGVSFYYNVQDIRLGKNGSDFTISGQKDRAQMSHNFTQLVLAAGLQTPQLLHAFNIRMQLADITGVAVNFAKPDTVDWPSRPIMDSVSRSALTVFDDHVRLSGGWDIKDPQIILDRWAEIAPALMLALDSPLSIWTGHRPVSAVGRPYIGATSVPGLWVNTGHGHMGWTLSAGSAEVLAAAVCDGATDARFSFAG